MTTIRSFKELSKFSDFEERYEYLKLGGLVGESTFGYDRYLNQTFYRSTEWKRVRRLVILRDDGRDLGVKGYEIEGKILIHHMNPLTKESIVKFDPAILDPEFLISVSERTHQAIHYGDKTLLPQIPVIRQPGDTRLW